MVKNMRITSSLIQQGSQILHNTNPYHVVGHKFQLYPALHHICKAIHPHMNMVMQHIKPLTKQEVQMLKLST